MAQSAFIEMSNYVIEYEPSIFGYIRDDLRKESQMQNEV